MAKKAAVQKHEWKLVDGVGLNTLSKNAHCPWHTTPHYVVLMQSLHGGTEVFGPFLNEAAAIAWSQSDDCAWEINNNYGRFNAPGVSVIVKWLDVPTTRIEGGE